MLQTNTSFVHSNLSFPTQENDANLKDASATAPMKPAQVFSAPAWAQAKGMPTTWLPCE